MKRSISLVVITLLVLGCSAAFGEGLVTLGLKGHDGTQYCAYFNFSYGTSLASGIDVRQLCGSPDGTMIGVTTNATTPHLNGKVVFLADSIVDALCNCYNQQLFVWLTKTKASSTNFGWEVYYNNYDEFHEYLSDWGYLTKHLGP